MLDPFIRKLRHGAHLTDEDARVLSGLCSPPTEVAARTEILTEGDAPRALTLILSGWACLYKQLEDGHRQILELFLPGDLCEPFGILPRFVNHSFSALTHVVLCKVRPNDAVAAAASRPGIAEALWWDALVRTAMLHERVVSLGCRSSTERLAHLLCELHARLSLVGCAEPDGFVLPLTQAQLGEIMGLSSVHVNRTLQELRSTGMIALRDKRVTICDHDGLRALAQFDLTFLHLRSSREAENRSSMPPSASSTR